MAECSIGKGGSILRGTAIALFAKAPRPGHAKTRLTARLSAAEAAEFHRLCTLEAWGKLQRIAAADAFLYCDLPGADFGLPAASGRARLQRGADLGEKLRRCLDELLAQGYRKALIVGSDSPTLPAAHIEAADGALDRADVVLGPSADGGFYLIGARKTDARMFAGVAWSRAETRAQTIRALRAAALGVALTGAWYDVDEPADLDRLRADPHLPPSLRRWFAARLQ